MKKHPLVDLKSIPVAVAAVSVLSSSSAPRVLEMTTPNRLYISAKK